MVIMTTPTSASEPRTTRANNSREQILDAYEHLLVQAGERAATLDAVAAQAKVSKGGLLYHFGSKKALFEALLDRTRTYADEDLEKMRAAPEGPAPITSTPQPFRAPHSIYAWLPSRGWRRIRTQRHANSWTKSRGSGMS